MRHLVMAIAMCAPLAGALGCVESSSAVPARSARELATTEAAGALQQVTRGGGDQVNPAVAPDGKWLAFEARAPGEMPSVVVAAPARADAPRFHVPKSEEPAWTPKGDAIVFVSEEDGHPRVVRRMLDAPDPGALLVPLGDPKHDAIWPTMSPDGDHLASSMLRLGVYDSHDLRRRWFDAAIEITTVNGYGTGALIGDGVEAAWSPRGDAIAFVREAGGHGHLFVAKGSGAEATQLTDGSDEDALPSWSPDGKWIAFCSAHAAEDGRMDRVANLFVVGADGNGLTQLTEGDVFACRPSWAKDGWIYFHADAGNGFHVWRMKWKGLGQSLD